MIASWLLSRIGWKLEISSARESQVFNCRRSVGGTGGPEALIQSSAPQDRNVQGLGLPLASPRKSRNVAARCEYSSTILGTKSGPHRASDATPCVTVAYAWGKFKVQKTGPFYRGFHSRAVASVVAVRFERAFALGALVLRTLEAHSAFVSRAPHSESLHPV